MVFRTDAIFALLLSSFFALAACNGGPVIKKGGENHSARPPAYTFAAFMSRSGVVIYSEINDPDSRDQITLELGKLRTEGYNRLSVVRSQEGGRDFIEILVNEQLRERYNQPTNDQIRDDVFSNALDIYQDLFGWPTRPLRPVRKPSLE